MKPFLSLGCILLASAMLTLTSCKSNQGSNPYAQGSQPQNPYGNYPSYGQPGAQQQGGYPSQSDYVDPQPVQDYGAGGGYAQAPNPYAEAPYQSQPPAYTPPAPSYPDYSGPQPTTPVRGYAGTYTVVRGDTLYSIGRRHGTKAEAIKDANGLTSDLIHPGDVLNIP